MTDRRHFQTLDGDGLEFDSLPMRLWSKGKKLGTWDPASIDFEEDVEDWRAMGERDREALMHVTAQFLGGEESVTEDLLPLIAAISEEGRLEEEMYLTSFLFEEAKHVEVFSRFFDQVVDDPGDLTRFHDTHYETIFHDALPSALHRLRDDRSPKAQAEASATYNMIVEGVLAETGYHAYYEALESRDVMPGLQEVTRLLEQDESRHMAYGVYLLSRLVDAHGEPVWTAIDERMNTLLPHALGMIENLFETYDEMPLGLEKDDFIGYATEQFQKRYNRIEPD
jgi:ribonucleoside-diphosphate reductase beta chain